jgi:thiol-disulfide isomerase/thioredoxin
VFDPNDTARAEIKDTLLYYSDYAVKGEMTLGGKKYTVMLTDDLASGDFRPKVGDRPSGKLLIDRDGDGKFDRRFESYDPGKPFNIAGVTYEIQGVTANGGKFDLVKSARTVAEIAPPPDLHSGQKALTFEAKTTDGKSVAFPSSFKGKIVMLDFWAMWCGPCVGELPNLTAAYKTYHGKGFEILGISLDQPNMAEKLATFTKEHEMPWAQVYEGKLWDVSLVKMHGVNAIPFAILVDGDTGEVLAGDGLRGAALATTIEKALAKKEASGTLKAGQPAL